MPKSFLVKKRPRSKEYPTQEENIASDQDEQNISKCEKTHFSIWNPCAENDEILKPKSGVELSRRATLSRDATKLTSDYEAKPRRVAAADLPKLVEHATDDKLPATQNGATETQHINGTVNKGTVVTKGNEKQCNRCQRSYTTNAALVKHQRYYCNFFQTKSFTCKYCDKVYLSLGALKMHIRTHTLPCQCMICGKSFSRPWLLQGHVRTHTGEKPYECSNCNRAFADRSNLRAHLQTHSDVKKYKCEQCSKTFSRMSLLLKHRNACCSVS